VLKNIKFYFVYISKRFKELLEQKTFKTYKKNFKHEMVQHNTGKYMFQKKLKRNFHIIKLKML